MKDRLKERKASGSSSDLHAAGGGGASGGDTAAAPAGAAVAASGDAAVAAPAKVSRTASGLSRGDGASSDGWLFQAVSFGLDMRSRICIVGPNGVGKSTLLNLMAGVVQPISGLVDINRKVRIARYNQHFMDQLPMDKTAIEYMLSLADEYHVLWDDLKRTDDPDDKSKRRWHYQSVRGLLGRYGLSGDTHTILIKELSGGQKARVAFASMYLQKPHLLILDEPTNHLDIESIDALVAAINEYNGGVVLVHDARLITETNSVLWVIPGPDGIAVADSPAAERVARRGVGVFGGEFDDYRQHILQELEAAAEGR